MGDREWTLGQTSSKYETGGRGPGTVSSGFDDPGGVSYGSYQMTSQTMTRSGDIIRGGTVAAFLKHSNFGNEFAGMAPGDARFNEKWKALAKADPTFADAQHAYIKQTHYDRMTERLKHKGLDLSDRGQAVQDALWSTAVQYGPGSDKKPGGSGVFLRALDDRFGKGFDISKVSDREIIEAVQDYKADHVRELFPRVDRQRTLDALMHRAVSEKADLLKLLEHERSTVQEARQPRADAGMQADSGYLRVMQAASQLSGYDPEQQRNIGAALYAQHAANTCNHPIDSTLLGKPLPDGRQFLFARYSPWGEAGPHFTSCVELGEAARIPLEQSLMTAEATRPPLAAHHAIAPQPEHPHPHARLA